MRVLQINSVCGVGSTGRIATDIHAILKEQGHESFIAYGRNAPINCDSTLKIGNKLDNYAHVANTRLLDKHGFGSKKATKEFIAKVKELDPDVIHLHNIHGYYINIEVLFDYLKMANKPVIWTLHDCWAFTGHCSHFDYIGCNKWRVGCHDCPQKREYPKSNLVDNSNNNYFKKRDIFSGVKNLTIVSPSKWLAKLVEKSFLNEYPVKVINNGIDLEIFKPSESNFIQKNNLKNKFIILGVASIWGERKGFSSFLELSGKLESGEIIVLVGVTEHQKERLPNNILGITRTNNAKELAEIYSAADVFVNPTLEDNFPTTNIEAQACGTPIITFATGGSIESVNENTGSIIEKGNLSQLRYEIGKIKKIGKHSYKDKCIENANIRFGKIGRFLEYLNLYEHISTN